MDNKYSRQIRAFRKTDHQKVIELFRRNAPKFFHPDEEKDLIDYLKLHATNYFVYEIDRQIIAAGGINYFKSISTARISWDMVHPDFQGMGIGKSLTRYRIELIKKDISIHYITVRTSQWAVAFYQKMGFNLERIEKDFWAKGFDLYLMTYPLS